MAAYDKPPVVESVLFPAFRAKLPSMEGKVVAITGCTSGTGFICARTCAQLGARVIMLNRPSERADKALLDLQKAIPAAQLSLVGMDLMSFANVKEAATKLKAELGDTGLDVLVNNAGIMAVKDEATKDGCDTQMQTNHLSHFLLTAEMWPQLEKAAELHGEARVVNHSSGARKGSKLEKKFLERNGGNLGGDAADPKDPKVLEKGRWKRYQQSKLANLVFTYALRDRAVKAGSKVKALVAHPGLSATNLQVTTAADGGLPHDFANVLMQGAQSQEDGTMGLIRASCFKDVKNGDFYGPKGSTGPADLLDPKPEEELADEASRTMLWETSLAMTGRVF